MLKLRHAVAACCLLVATITSRSHDGVDLRAAAVDDLPQVRTLSTITGDASMRSGRGEELAVYQFGARDDTGAPLKGEFRFFVQGGLHGNEEMGSRFVVWLARRYARGESMLNLLPKHLVEIDFLPFANPDGTHAESRYNERGVNLNRNFGVLWGVSRENPGQDRFSEPETRAIRALFEKRRYTAAVDVHGYINWIVAPTTPEQIAARGTKPKKTQVTAYRRWMGELKDQMPLLPNYQLKTAGALGDGGAFEDWAFWSEGTFAYCLELESFQRFVRSYRPDFADITRHEERRSVDLFTRYEAFVYRMFDAAIRIKTTPELPAQLAVQP